MSDAARQAADSPIGFIGLGAMGMPIAHRLYEQGHDLVVWTRNTSKAADIAGTGVRFGDDPADVARSCRVVLSCLLNDDAIEQVYLGPSGLIAESEPGSLLVEHGTFTPQLARQLHSVAANRKIGFLDAPVSGGSARAKVGGLVTMIGGDLEAVERLTPIAAVYCSLIERIGPSGTGVTLKLINQMLVATHALSTVEAAAMVRAAGIPIDVANWVLNRGWAASTMLARNLTPAITGNYPDEGADIGGLTAVLGLVRDLAASMAVPNVLEPMVYAQFRAASAAGLAHEDLSALQLDHNPANGFRP
jgi:3-hydroxyisobutyrate dehydrogenase-like beta-hydroxyacid dehydrogenase